jgi:hypothetical protein
MAISNLVSGGQSFERPSVSAFFGKSMTGANDNVEKVSSNFLSNDMLKAIVGAFDGIGKELSRIQDVSKNIMKSFDTLIKNTRDLNRDITRRFRDVNDQLNKSKIDFLRSVMMTPIPASDSPTTLGSLVDSTEKKTEDAKKQEEKKDEGKSWTDTLGDWLSTAGDVANVADMFKKGGGAGAAAGEAKAGSKMAGFLGKSAGVAGRLLGKLAVPLAVATSAYDAYQGFSANEDAGIGEKLGNAGSTVLHGLTFGLLGKSSEEIAQSAAENKAEALQQLQMLPPTTIKYWQTWPELIKAWTDGTIKKEDRAKVMKMFADGESEKATSYAARIAGIEAAKTEPKLADSKKNITARNLAATIRGPEAGRDIDQFAGAMEKASRGIEAATGEVLDEDQIKNKRIAGLAIKYGLTPSTVTATLEGGVPTSLTSNGVTVDVYNDLTPEEKDKVNTARKMRSEMRGDAKKNEAPQAPGANPPAGNAAGDNAGAGGPTGAAGANAPAAAATAPPANNVAGSSEGDQGAPEKAPAAPGGGAGGAGATGGESAPAGAPTPAPPAASSGSSEGGAAGGSTGAPEAAPAATPSPGGGGGAPAAEGMGTSGSPDGAPAAPSAAPTTPSAPPPTPEAPAGGGEPIVMNNSSSQSIGKAAAGETSVMSGQNLPMSAQNEKIQEYLARQTVNYQ